MGTLFAGSPVQTQVAVKGRIASLDGWRGIAIFFVACSVIVARRPDAIFHAQFYAEDGSIWFAGAFNASRWWQPLLTPYDGYFNAVARLSAEIALIVPLSLAPLAENILAIVVHASPVSLLLSPRSSIWGTTGFRIWMAALYLLLPNMQHMFGTITEAQWTLALSAFLLLMAAPPISKSAKIAHDSILLLSGLSGPFCLFLLPIAWLKRRGQTVLLAVCSAIQITAIILHGARYHAPLGTSSELLRILTGQVYLGTLLGGNGLGLRLPLFWVACIAAAGTGLLLMAFKNGAFELRSLIVLSMFLLLASVADPTVPDFGIDTWLALSGAPGNDYWFFPCLAFGWALLHCIRGSHQATKIASGFLLALMTVGVVRDFRCPPFNDLHFSTYVQRLATLPHRSEIVIPENPQGWTLRLYKR